MSNSAKILRFAESFNSEAGSIYIQLPGGFAKIAMRALDAVLKRVDTPLYSEQQGDFVAITPLKIADGKMNTQGFCALDAPNMEMNPGHNPAEWARLHAIYADDAWTALYLLGAGMYYATNILGKKGVIPDNSLTGDAQKVIKRLFAQGQKNHYLTEEKVKKSFNVLRVNIVLVVARI